MEYTLAQNQITDLENQIASHYRSLVDDRIERATTLEELEEVKQLLRPMPYCASKTLIFRSIIVKENEINV